MRLVGQIQGYRVVILIDTESTHNFMDPSIVKRAPLQTIPTEGLVVKVAKGDTIINQGRCLKVVMHMQGNSYSTDFCLNFGWL